MTDFSYDDWTAWLLVRQRRSPKTTESYVSAGRRYVAWLAERGLTPAAVTPDTLSAFFAELIESGFASNTLQKSHTAIQSLHAYLMDSGLSAADPTAAFERPAALRRRSGPTVRLPVPTPENIERAADVARTKLTETQKPVPRANQARRLALIETLWATGMETDEALHLPGAVATTDDDVITVRPPWRPERVLKLPERAFAAIRVWRRAAIEATIAPSPWLFHSIPGGEHPLSRHAAAQDLRRAAIDAGLAPTLLLPKAIRRAFLACRESSSKDDQLSLMPLPDPGRHLKRGHRARHPAEGGACLE